MNQPDDIRTHWPLRPDTERRLYPRIRIELPVQVRVGRRDAFDATAEDISLGGLRVFAPDPLPLQSQTRVSMTLSLTARSGEQESHRFEADALVVRVISRGGMFGMSLEFSDADPTRERLVGIFMLQTMLFVPDVEFT